jgi:hypothetical protein
VEKEIVRSNFSTTQPLNASTFFDQLSASQVSPNANVRHLDATSIISVLIVKLAEGRSLKRFVNVAVEYRGIVNLRIQLNVDRAPIGWDVFYGD